MELLQNQNIKLRAPEITDAEFIYNCENHTENWDTGSSTTPFSMQTILEHITNSFTQDIFTTKQFRFIIVQKVNNSSLGIVDIYDYDPLHMRCGVGIIIFPDENKKKSIGFQALEILKAYCFDFLRLQQIYCDIADNNRASISLFKKANFKKSGTKKEWLNTANGFVDVSFFQCFTDEEPSLNSLQLT